LCTGKALLPPALAFCFDSEDLTELQRKDLETESKGRISFIPRKMYEDYLLNAGAIASVLNEVHSEKTKPISAQDVAPLIDAKKTVNHAAKVLKEVFYELSENKVSYDKVRHGLRLTEWILKNEPKDFEDLLTFLKKLLSK
jgi:hypothetical protein